MINEYNPGQRWFSETEPELGAGTILTLQERDLTIYFPSTEETRNYSFETAPLKRILFRVGDLITSSEGSSLTVEKINEKNGLLIYCGQGKELPENELSDELNFTTPFDRLINGEIDDIKTFKLRKTANRLRAELESSSVRGFCGGRVELIPHQLYISHEVCSRYAPRVLLADEAGLGKTIEAGMILHRLYLTGRGEKLLVVVPDALVYQWLVEMLRKFNMLFTTIDANNCPENIETNPFLEASHYICSLSFLVSSGTLMKHVADVQWDSVVIDEAHHIKYSPDTPSKEFMLAEELAKSSRGLILLSATPDQLGLEGHFARLQLLDSGRFNDFEEFKNEQADHEKIAECANVILDNSADTAKIISLLKETFPNEPEFAEYADKSEELLKMLIDRHGTGRMIFRNRRKMLGGFPNRIVKAVSLDKTENEEQAKIEWLANLLKENKDDKFLLITHKKETVKKIDEKLKKIINIKTAMFHEDLSLVNRDRNAAHFADDNGARILMCSEIGSEGRNFQFAHNLVFFDLPEDPSLLEQRIGRLDRIGQKHDIKLVVPFVKESQTEIIFRWFHEGLNAFERTLQGAEVIYEKLLPNLKKCLEKYSLESLKSFVAESAKLTHETEKMVENGRDRLLELNSFNQTVSDEIIADLESDETKIELQEFMFAAFQHFGIVHEEHSPNEFFIIRGPDFYTESFAGLKDEGMLVTFKRSKAVAREELTFLTWDHPMVIGCVDLLLSSEKGNSSFARIDNFDKREILLEADFVLECTAPALLQAFRFFPKEFIAVTANHKLKNISAEINLEEEELLEADINNIIGIEDVRNNLLPEMLKLAESAAEEKAQICIDNALKAMNSQLSAESARLKELQKVNKNVREEEIQFIERQKDTLAKAFKDAKIRLDAVRIVWNGPEFN